MAWELIFMLVILKIPVIYLCAVIYWAIKAEPRPLEGAAAPAKLPTSEEPPSAWWWLHRRPRRPRPGPHGSPARAYLRTRRAAAPLQAARR